MARPFLPETVNAAYVRAHLFTEKKDLPQARQAWEDFLRHSSKPPQDTLFAYVRILHSLSEPDRAADWLRRALQLPSKYGALARIEPLVSRIICETSKFVRRCRIAVLGTSTTSLVTKVLRILCFRDLVQATFYEGVYGAIEQEILDPRSGLVSFRPDIVFLVLNWRDLRLPPVCSDEPQFVSAIVHRFADLWKRLGTSLQCHVVQHTFDYPVLESYGELASSLVGGRTRMIELVNRALREAHPPFVSFLDSAGVQREVGHRAWADPFQWHHYRQHPGTEALPALAEVQVAHIRAVLGLTRKVLITDLDNTLWGGVIGEDGIDGIRMAPAADRKAKATWSCKSIF